MTADKVTAAEAPDLTVAQPKPTHVQWSLPEQNTEMNQKNLHCGLLSVWLGHDSLH